MSQALGIHHGNPSQAGQYTADTYSRRADHTPQTTQSESETYILALNTDTAHHKAVTALRNQYFPANLNKLSAHIALFRALPGSELPAIQTAIEDLVRRYQPFPISTSEPFIMAHGVGLGVNAEPAKHIFQRLKEQWASFLSKQDQSFKAHYTIQNKVEKGVPQRTLEEVRTTFHGSTGTVDGLSLYLYDKGYWRLKRNYPFGYRKEEEKAPIVDKSDGEEWPSLGASKPAP
ncbi:MAG: hypothetical protein Q9166_007112 [cf. Caloplaca sp. 2 TL-2023]